MEPLPELLQAPRYMYVDKFISLLPHLDKERIARFATVVTAQSGLVVIDTERIG
jgi:hypothetical protein